MCTCRLKMIGIKHISRGPLSILDILENKIAYRYKMQIKVNANNCSTTKSIYYTENMKTVGPGPTNIRPDRQIFKLVDPADR